MISNELLLKQAELYGKSRGLQIIRQPILGHGSDGAVWRTSRDTALKVLEKQHNYECDSWMKDDKPEIETDDDSN